MANKYKNKQCVYNNINFDSEMERDYYIYLLTQYNQEDIILQPVFELQPKYKKDGKTIRAITYVADFQIDKVVIDIKGFTTSDFMLKKKMFDYIYNEYQLLLITRPPKYAGVKWIELSELKKLRKERK